MKGPHNPGSPPTVASERQGTVSKYAFKEENIEAIYQNHLYVPNFLLPAGGAMTISGYWHVDIFRKHFNQTYEVWLQIEHSILSV